MTNTHCLAFTILVLGMGPSIAAGQPSLQLSESAEQITIRSNAALVLSYNKLPPSIPPGIPSIYRRSGFLHPVASPQGGVVTDVYPADHPHQNGIFSAWVKTTFDGKNIDFWNLAKQSGRVTHERVVSTFCDHERAGFEIQLLHQISGAAPVNVLRETWKVICHRNDSGRHVFDLESTQQAQTDQPLVVEEYHYGGMALRGPATWILNQAEIDTGCKIMNSQGSRREEGNHQSTNWVVMSGEQHGQPVNVAVLCHPANFRAPQQARLHPKKPYFCFAPCAAGEFAIDRKTPLHSRYRFIVSDGIPDVDWLDEHWRQWCMDKAIQD